MSDVSGTISRQGTFVYAPQIAWVFSGTLRENILFGESYHEPRYTRIIEACALTEDFQRFPNGDQTVVGERGAVLSGGQRARVSLARAVYVDADLYLLDDPLSAVDFKVGRHIFEKCIKGLLGEKTRLLTSHQEQHMKDADRVIVLHKGRVLGKGAVYVDAVYVDADLSLLDDPLSAVDFKVGRHIFEKCIKGLLSEKTRLLTSHQEQHMKIADQVIILQKGCVRGKGTFAKLKGERILNAVIDPLYKNALTGSNSNDNNRKGNEEKRDNMMPLTSDCSDLKISIENRAIGTVSRKLYWDYFRSGIHTCLIIGFICFCLITQGEP